MTLLDRPASTGTPHESPAGTGNDCPRTSYPSASKRPPTYAAALRKAGPVASRGPIVPARWRTVRIARSASNLRGAGVEVGVGVAAAVVGGAEVARGCGGGRWARVDVRPVRAPGRQHEDCDGGDDPAAHAETVVRRWEGISPTLLPCVYVEPWPPRPSCPSLSPRPPAPRSPTAARPPTTRPPRPTAGQCDKDNLNLLNAGQLTVGTDSPAYEPWFVDNDPTQRQGLRVGRRLRGRRPARLLDRRGHVGQGPRSTRPTPPARRSSTSTSTRSRSRPSGPRRSTSPTATTRRRRP